MTLSRSLVVTTPPTNIEFTTSENVIADVGAFAQSDRLDRFVTQASDEIITYLRYPFVTSGHNPIAETAYTETIWLDDHPSEILLSRQYLIEDPIVSIDGVAQAAADIIANLNAGVIYRLSDGKRVPWCGDVITIEYTSGYKLPADGDAVSPSIKLPPAIERAAIDLVAFRFQLATGEPCGTAFKAINLPGAGNLSFDVPSQTINAQSMPVNVATILEPYRHTQMGFR